MGGRLRSQQIYKVFVTAALRKLLPDGCGDFSRITSAVFAVNRKRCDRDHSAARRLCARFPRGAEGPLRFRNPSRRRIMSVQEINEIRELTSDEVDQVNGGLVVIAIIAVLIGLLVPAVQ
jgi:hypothetical protein